MHKLYQTNNIMIHNFKCSAIHSLLLTMKESQLVYQYTTLFLAVIIRKANVMVNWSGLANRDS